jgi:hypothetical protein
MSLFYSGKKKTERTLISLNTLSIESDLYAIYAYMHSMACLRII